MKGWRGLQVVQELPAANATLQVAKYIIDREYLDQRQVGHPHSSWSMAASSLRRILRPEHFADPVNAQIYEKALLIYNEGRLVDPLTIIRHFEHPDDLIWGKANPKEYIAKLVIAMVSPRLALDYAREIRDAAMRRELMALCQQTSDLCCRPEDQKAEEIVEGHEASLLHIAMGISESQPNVTFHEALCNALLSARAAVERGSALAGLFWGYRSLDRLTNGLVGGKSPL